MTRRQERRSSYGPLFSQEKDSALIQASLERWLDSARRDPKKLEQLRKALGAPTRLSRVLGKALAAAATKTSPQIFRSLKARGPAMLREQRATFAGFERRLYRTWKRPLDLLEMFIVVCSESGESLSAQWPWKESPEQNLVFDVIRRLQARACQAASEILTLLKAGYAPAAHARWRTLHEMAATAFLIARHGKDVAERFLAHEHVEAWKAAEQYQRCCSRLGERRFSRKEMATFRRNYGAALKRYGPDFKNPYGWAAAALGNKSPKFADIEKAAGLDHMRPYYRMASYPVHATAKTIRFSLALMPRQDILFTGPSGFGLADPGHSTAISLGQITTATITLLPSCDTVSVGRVLLMFTDEIGKEFIKVHRRVEARAKRRP